VNSVHFYFNIFSPESGRVSTLRIQIISCVVNHGTRVRMGHGILSSSVFRLVISSSLKREDLFAVLVLFIFYSEGKPT